MGIKIGKITQDQASSLLSNKLKEEGYILEEPQEISYGFQFKLQTNGKHMGVVRIYKSDKGASIDLSQIKDYSDKEKISSIVYGLFKLEDKENGEIRLPKRYYIRNKGLMVQIKKRLLKEFGERAEESKPKKGQNYVLRINGITLVQYESGTLVIQGAPTKFSDKLVNITNEVYGKQSSEDLIKCVKPQIEKTDFKELVKELKKPDTNVLNYVSEDLYNYLYNSDRIELKDGVALLDGVKTHNISLKNYVVLVRNFSIAYEGFLIKVFEDLDLIDKEEYAKDKGAAKVGKFIRIQENGDSEFSKRFGTYYCREDEYLTEKIWALWSECRNKFLHSDHYATSNIKRIGRAEGKINELLDTMEKLLHIRDKIKSSSNLNSKRKESLINYIGTDESGKGDYFGPLVIAGVHVDSEEKLRKLNLLGVVDSKKLSDNQAMQMADEIRKICVADVVTINPPKYNELYRKIKNLNRLLAWGHARVIENLLNEVDCSYVISDQFGDESFIENALMKEGKRVLLDQRPKAEENIVVAAASILARAEFLRRLDGMGKQYMVEFPKGASDKVKKTAKKFVKNNSKEKLKEVAKIHFKITKEL